MRRIFTLLLLLAGLYSTAQPTIQPYNNEWIHDYGRTYYKVKIASPGIYRIPKSLLDAIGIGNADVRNYEIYRNGEKVPFYPSVSSGTLPAGGYIEFWGRQNDGKPDKALYRDPAFQHSEYHSLQTDTAIYFLSVNTDASGFQIKDVANNVAGSSLTPETEFLYTAGHYPNRGNTTGLPNLGLASPVGTLVYSSSYDRGEFFASEEVGPGGVYSAPLSGLNISAGSSVTPVLKFGAVGNRLLARHVKVRVNGSEVIDVQMDWFNDVVTTANVPVSLIAAGSGNFEFQNATSEPGDRMAVSFFELTYMRTYDFSNTKNFEFQLPAKSSGYLLKISNFNHTGVPPVLYDLTNGERYAGDLSSAPGFVQFALPGSVTDRKLVLVSQDAANINTVTEATPRNFINYKQVSAQGDYLIVSNPLLYTGSSGNNPVNDYKSYRESAIGGGFKVTIADINELVDQFAFGIKKHPLSVHNYLRFARRYFSKTPAFCFLIGRGTNYVEYQRTTRRPATYPLGEQLNLVPSWGHPASDNLMAAEDIKLPVASTPIGRLSVVTGKEIEDYLEKIREYELTQKTAPNTVSGRAWMKNIVHVTGSSEHYLGTVLCNYMNVYKQMVEDTMFGGRVTTFCKESTNPVEQLTSERLSTLFADGISFLTYFGHSSATTLEFNIDNPQAYNNQGKYPVFFVNGCNAGNFFTYFPNRFVANETLSEKFVLAKQRGSIAFVASTHFGIVNYLNSFLLNLYDIISGEDYNKSLGDTYRQALGTMYVTATYDEFYFRMHAEQITLNGDPAIRINTAPKPDYVVEPSLIKVNPAFISLAEKNYELKVKVINLGRSTADSVMFEIKQQYPNGTTGILYRQKIRGIRSADSVTLDVPILATRDKGQNKLIVTIDAEHAVDEVSEGNNTASVDFFIFEDEARPVYPYNYAIINNPTQTLYASTANPVSASKSYTMEIDTSGSFTSAMKVRKTVTSGGGIIEFNHGLSFLDSTVYYWRISPSAPTEEAMRWNRYSFMYVNGTVDGFNQSTFFQHRESDQSRVFIDSASREWKYGVRNNNLFIRNGVYPSAAREADDFMVSINGSSYIESVCDVSGMVFYVIDPVTLKPWRNAAYGQPGRFGSVPICGVTREHQFQFNYSPTDTARRRKVVEFIDMIPAGHYVVVNNIFHELSHLNTYASQLAADTSFLGSNNSIYHRLLQQGFTNIDSINRNRSFIFLFQKDRLGFFTPKVTLSRDSSDRITQSSDIITPDTIGVITSPRFGPAKQWHQAVWDGTSMESPTDDNPIVSVVGIDNNNTETVLYTMDRNTHSLDLSAVVATQYPYLQLKMRNVDSVKLTPYQLKYWRITYDPAPEGGLAANLFLRTKDTVDIGQIAPFGIAFKNVSKTAFDSVLVKVSIIDRNNTTHLVSSRKYKPLITGDSITIVFDVDARNYPGANTVLVDVNPDNHQPEHHHFNNVLYHNLYVRPDDINPVLDVTFDGVHILNRDIVSAKPHIQIKLKDEARHLLLDDTTVSTVEVRYPDGTQRAFHFDGDTLRFTPATSGDDNTATIDFTPAFTNQLNPDGDDYELIVKGQDKSGNRPGSVDYRIGFKVIAKPMISNILNYPNPFSTSTAFVFTITGSELPQNIRIQILTVTGKIVREITMSELGPLRIGRNITEFKWDGTDQYGSRLANGVYLYRVVTSMNGKPMDKYRAKNDNTEKYFNNGYGKMYLMR